MRRREFIAAFGSTAVWPLAAHAQQGERVRRVAILNASGAITTGRQREHAVNVV
jgi:hypothetical protein